MQSFMLNILKKSHLKKSNILEAHQTLKILSVLILQISRHFQTTQENQTRLIQRRKISCNWEKKFFRLSQKIKKSFQSQSKKILISL